MALIKCEECGNEISEDAKICPKCGKKTKRKKRQIELVKIIVVLLLVIIIPISIIFIIGINNPVYRTTKETIELLKDYDEDRIDIKKATINIQDIKKKVEKAKDKSDFNVSDWRKLSSKIEEILTMIENDDITDSRLNEYIKELKELQIEILF